MLLSLLLPALLAQTPATQAAPVPSRPVAAAPARPGKLIQADQAKAMIQAYRNADATKRAAAHTLAVGTSTAQVNAVVFSVEAMRALVNTPGVDTVAWNFALKPDSTITLVGVGYDTTGTPVAYIDAGATCPPFCAPTP